MSHLRLLRVTGLLFAAALLTFAACSSSSTGTLTAATGGSASPAATSSPLPTATAAPSGCAALDSGSSAATPIPGFTSYGLSLPGR